MITYKQRERERFFQPTVNSISELLKLPVAIWVLDESQGRFQIAAGKNLAEKYIDEAYLRPDGPSIVAKVFREGKTTIVKDIKSEKRWRYKKQALKMGFKSAILVPLWVKKKTMGVLNVYIPGDIDFDSEKKKPIVESFAKQVAATLRQIRTLETLSEVSQLISSEVQHPNKLFNSVMLSAQKVLDCKHVSIFLVDKKNNELVLKATASTRLKRDRFKSGDGLAGQVVQSAKAILAPDACKHPKFVPGLTSPHIQKRSMLVVPIKLEDKVVGVISADIDGLEGFDKHDQMLLESIASQAAIAIHNVKLFQQSHDKAEALTELSKLAHSLVAIEESPDSRKLLKRIAESARIVLKADLIELYEYQPISKKFKLPQIWVGKKLHKLIPKEILSDDAIFQVIQRPKPLYVSDAQAKKSIFTAPFRIKRKNMPKERFVLREKIKSTAAIPLKTENEAMGLMFANYRTPQQFNKEQQELIELFANQAAIAIKNSQLYQYVNKRREALVKVGQELTSAIQLSEKEVLESIYEQASNQLGMENLSIAVYDEKTDKVHFALAALEGKRVNIEMEPGWEPREGGRGKTEKVIHSQKYWLIPTLEEVKKAGFSPVPGHKDSEGKIANSWLGVPMIIGERVLGVIATEHYGKDYYYKDEDIEILQALADQAAIALDNARLNERLNKVNRQQNALIEIGQKITAEIHLTEKEILELIYDQASKELYMKNLSIALYDETTDTIRWALAVVNNRRIDVESEKGWEIRPAKKGKTGKIINAKRPLLLSTLEEVKKAKFSSIPNLPAAKDDIIPNCWLGVPMMVGNEVLGVIANYDYGKDYAYDEDYIKILKALANQAAIALENARLYFDVLQKKEALLKQQEALLKKQDELVKRQKALVEFGSQLGSKIPDGETEILEFIHQQAHQFMDTNNMYIALYDNITDMVRFGMVFVKGKRINVKTHPRYQPRKAGEGRTEEIIRTKKPLFHPTKADGKAWYAQPGRKEYVGKVSPSWMGVPMIAGDKVIGVVATFHPTKDNVYNQDDLNILESMADLAAIALENTRMIDIRTHLEAEKREAEKWAYLGRIAGSLAHRIGNKGGLIRLGVQDLKDYFETRGQSDEWVSKQLNTIYRSNQHLLELSEFLFKPRKASEEKLEQVDVTNYLNDALRYAEIPGDVTTELDYAKGLPRVLGNKYMVEAFLELIVNAVHAMSKSPVKKLRITAKEKLNRVEIRFSDTGHGIAPDQEEYIFDLFSHLADKRPSNENHRGFGLWWVKTFFNDIGGDIRYERGGHNGGATFVVELSIPEARHEN